MQILDLFSPSSKIKPSRSADFFEMWLLTHGEGKPVTSTELVPLAFPCGLSSLFSAESNARSKSSRMGWFLREKLGCVFQVNGRHCKIKRTKGKITRYQLIYTKPDARTVPNAQAESMVRCCVYMFVCESGRYKIGYSGNVAKRLQSINNVVRQAAGLRVFKVGHIDCKNEAHAREVESRYHNLFASKRLDGEWFELDGSEVAQFLAEANK